MDFASSEPARTALASTVAQGLKIVVVGGSGVGKTTLVRSVSEISPLSTEETTTGATAGDPTHLPGKTTMTVAFDFGRISLDRRSVLYVFGAPSQERFWFLWQRLFAGALGAVVLVDSRRLADCWHSIDHLEQLGLPFVVARNRFGSPKRSLDEARAALNLPAGIPLVECDARERESSKEVLISLVSHAYSLSTVEFRGGFAGELSRDPSGERSGSANERMR